MASGTQSKEAGRPQKPPAVPRPSSSVILVSPTNQILLLHRVQKSSSFPSAHVFPGGNISTFHDGDVPGAGQPQRHEDSEAYRIAAVRETFEESGILLARNNGFGRLIEVEDTEREQGRKEIHASKIEFRKWLASKGGRADVDGLIPFTRWVTPIALPKRFTTQMYIYFLPLSSSEPSSTPANDDAAAPNLETLSLPSREVVIPPPTHDGGLEHTAARFLHAETWLRMSRSGEIILFPPQYMLLHLVGSFLTAPATDSAKPFTREELSAQRKALQAFVKEGDPPWGEKCISPVILTRRKSDGRVVLGLDKPGPELKGSERRGEVERVVLVDFQKEGPRRVEVEWRKDLLKGEREQEPGWEGKL